jgi:hypothetical protein
MLHASNREKSRTIGYGRGGITDKILHGSDSRLPVDRSARDRAHVPSLQDTILLALINEVARIILVDQTELVGRVCWYSDGRFGLKSTFDGRVSVLSCNRVLTVSPIGVDQEAVPFITESFRQALLISEERSSRLQIVRRRIQERNKRLQAAANFHQNRTQVT